MDHQKLKNFFKNIEKIRFEKLKKFIEKYNLKYANYNNKNKIK